MRVKKSQSPTRVTTKTRKSVSPAGRTQVRKSTAVTANTFAYGGSFKKVTEVDLD